MKKFLIFLVMLFLIFGGLILFNKQLIEQRIPILDIEEEVINVDKLYIYGTHFNMEGNLLFNDNANLVLYNGEFIEYDINSYNLNDSFKFNLSELINDGIYLEDIPLGEYYMFIRIKDTENLEEDNEEVKWKYYALKNNTEYIDTTYYSLSKNNKKIVIGSEESYPTMTMTVTDYKKDNVYDVVIDPGHGGMDGGASKNGYKETDFTLNMATKLKEKLEEDGIKVKLTHEIGQLNSSEKLEEYGSNGRAVIPREVNAKYLFSLHLNSSDYSSISGLEVYTAKNINYDFAKKLVDNIISNTGLNYSNNKINKVYDGIYSRNFTNEDIKDSLDGYVKRKLNAYDITTSSSYYYMIRETGGIITGAYVDDRNDSILGNPYVKSNVGTESYLLELGYLSNKKDLNNVINNTDSYINSIADSIKTLFK